MEESDRAVQLIRSEDRQHYLWGDDESGHIVDWYYLASDQDSRRRAGATGQPPRGLPSDSNRVGERDTDWSCSPTGLEESTNSGRNASRIPTTLEKPTAAARLWLLRPSRLESRTGLPGTQSVSYPAHRS